MLQIQNISRNSNTDYSTTIGGVAVHVSYTCADAAPSVVNFNANKQVDSTLLSLFKSFQSSGTFTDSEKEIWGSAFCTTAELLVSATFANYTDPSVIEVEEVVDSETA